MPLLAGYESSEAVFELPGSVPFDGSFTPDSPRSSKSGHHSKKGSADLQQENFSLRKLLADSEQRFKVTLQAYESERDRANQLNQKCEEMAGAVELANTRYTDVLEENDLLKTKLAKRKQITDSCDSLTITSRACPGQNDPSLLDLQLLRYQAPTIGQLQSKIEDLERNLAERDTGKQDDNQKSGLGLELKRPKRSTRQISYDKVTQEKQEAPGIPFSELLSSPESPGTPHLPRQRHRGTSEPNKTTRSEPPREVDPDVLIYYKRELKRAKKRIEVLQEARSKAADFYTVPYTPVSATSDRSIYPTSSPTATFQQHVQKHSYTQDTIDIDTTRRVGNHSSSTSQSSSSNSSWINSLSSKMPFKSAKKLPRTDSGTTETFKELPPVPGSSESKSPIKQTLRSTPSASSIIWRPHSRKETTGTMETRRPKTAQPHRGAR